MADNRKVKRKIIVGNEVLETPPTTEGAIRLDGHNGTFYMSYDDLATGLALIGSTGCGKTTVLDKILQQLMPALSADDIMIVLVSKSEDLEKWYDLSNPKHLLVSTREKYYKTTWTWNTFLELSDNINCFNKHSEYAAKEISQCLFKSLEGDQNPFFPIASADILEKAMISLVRDSISRKDAQMPTNQDLCWFFESAQNASSYYTQIGKYCDFNYIQSYLGNGMSNQALGIYGFIQSCVSKSFFGPFREKSLVGEFSMRKLLREKGGKILFLEYDPASSECLETVYSLLVDLAIKQAIEVSKGNTFIIADEVRTLPYLKRLQDAVNFGRSKGLKTIIGLQSINQLYDNYGENQAKAILAGFLSMFAFHAVDFDTRKYISERFGTTFEVYNFAGTNLTREGFAVEDSDIRSLNIGEAFIDLKGQPPFRFHFKK